MGVTMFRYVVFIFLFLSLFGTKAQDISSYGKEFLFAIPPNDSEENRAELNVLKIYITSVVKSNVEVVYNGSKQSYIIQANSTKEIELKGNASYKSYKYKEEVYETGIVKNKTFEISSDQDISVSVLNSKSPTADSFIVFPTKAWGNNYMHLAYWDMEWKYNRMFTRVTANLGSGMLIIAKSDSTTVTIKYKGQAGTETLGGYKSGQTETVTLNEGEVFSFRSNGKGERQYDLSGTQVISNKPVGAISYHQRTAIPGNSDVNGKDHLVEMVPPVTTWGKKYVCVQFERDDIDNRWYKKWGDYFRGVASEDGTVITCKYYDLKTGEKYDELQFELDANEVFEYNGQDLESYNNKSIRGISIWESNKPFMLMQYCYSADWDGDTEFDPFMTLAVPTEQYVNYSVFNVPGKSSGILSSYANILVNVKDDEKVLLKSIKMDGQALSTSYPQIALNKVPGEDLYWLRVPIKEGNHIIESEAKFGAYLYGFGEYISYGHTTSQGFETINNDGNPVIKIVENGCGDYSVEITDSSGIASISLSNAVNVDYDTTGFYQNINKFKYAFPINVSDLELESSIDITATDVLGFESTYSFKFPDINKAKYEITLSNQKTIYDTSDSIKVDLKISASNWKAYPLDSIWIELDFDPSKYSILSFESNLGNDFDIGEVQDQSNTSNIKYLIKFKSLEGSYLDSDTTLGTINLKFMWDNDLQPSFTAEIQNTPYSTNCIERGKDTITTVLSMCAPELFEIVMGENYQLTTISPNPVQNDISFSLTVPYDTHGNIGIYDLNGNLIENIYDGIVFKGTNDYKATVESYPAGVYMLKVKAGLMDTYQKILKVD